MFTIFSIALDRFLMINYPFKHRFLMSGKKMAFWIFSIWLVSAIHPVKLIFLQHKSDTPIKSTIGIILIMVTGTLYCKTYFVLKKQQGSMAGRKNTFPSGTSGYTSRKGISVENVSCVSDLECVERKNNIDRAQSQSDHAQSQSDHAQSQSDHAQSQSDRAQSQSDRAQSQSVRAQSQSDRAQSQSDRAQSQSDRAQSQSDRAQSQSGRAQSQSGRAQSQSDRAQSQRHRAQSQSDRVQSHYDRAQSQSDRAQSKNDRAQSQSNRARCQSDRAQSQSNRAQRQSDLSQTQNDRAQIQNEYASIQDETAQSKNDCGKNEDDRVERQYKCAPNQDKRAESSDKNSRLVNNAKEQKFLNTIIIIALIALITVLPGQIYVNVWSISGKGQSYSISFIVVITIFCLNFAINPLIYCLRLKRYRKTFRIVYGCK